MSWLYFALSQIKTPNALPQLDGSTGTLDTVIQIVLGILGALALLIITVSGFRYITSAGDPQKASNAKNGIVFALVGLIVAIAAEAIVVFVIKGVS